MLDLVVHPRLARQQERQREHPQTAAHSEHLDADEPLIAPDDRSHRVGAARPRRPTNAYSSASTDA
jgi:hypothetical protein